MSPNVPQDQQPSRASESTREEAENSWDVVGTPGETSYAVSHLEADPFASPRPSLNSNISIGSSASVDVAQQLANPHGMAYRNDGSSRHALEENPFASSTPSLGDADSIGRAASTDESIVIAPGSSQMTNTASGPAFGGNPCNSSSSSLNDDNGGMTRASSSEDPRAPGPAGFDRAWTGSRMAGNRQQRSTFDPSSPDRGQASIRVPPPVSFGHQSRRRSSTYDPFAPSEPEPERERRRGKSVATNPFESSEPTTGSPVSTRPSSAHRPTRLPFASDMPTPIAEESNPMDRAFGSVRFRPETSSYSAENSSGQPALDHHGRRSSSAAGPTEGRRKGSFAGFFTQRSSARRESQIDPGDATQRSVATGATSTGGKDDAGKKRSKSFAALPRFTHPFQSHDGEAINLDRKRRNSESNQRRPSTFQRMKSVSELLVNENPIPQRYRSRSVSSVAFFVAPMKRNNSVNPIFEEDIVGQKDNVREFIEAAKEVQERQSRSRWQKEVFRFAYLIGLVALVYFVFVGRPLWQGIGSIYYHFIHTSTSARNGVVGVFIGWAALQGCLPLIFCNFEAEVDDVESRDASQTALIIPAYKAASVLPETIIAALKVFRKEQIFVVANGNNPTPLDDTANVCKRFGVNHAWVPIGSKITAEFVGVSLTRKYKYIMLIDDDVHLPANLPLVTHRITGNTKCIGYTIKSTGANGARGTLIQQCQDMEYKASGLGRTFSGKYGSATFPHGAIILWERECLQNLFNVHPGFVISEDWYFGHCARASGCRIQFCSQVFVETETPPALFKSSSAARGGFGEMTVFKQRFYRWNYFFVHRIYDDGAYMLLSWRLGWREIVTKFYVLIELYDSCMALLRPWIVILTLIGDAKLFFIMSAALMVMYCLIFSWFNAWHLRKKNEMIQWRVLPVYLGMKFILLWVTCASVYYSIFHYAFYFMAKHPRVIESTQALEAAYNVRLGTDLVPLDRRSSAAAVTQEKETGSSSSNTADLEPMMEKVTVIGS